MPKLPIIRSDVEKEREGVWVTHPFGFEFKIARMGNAEYRKAAAALLTPELVREARVKGPGATAEAAAQQTPGLVARHILKDWRNVEGDDGEPIPYTPEVGERILSDPGYHDLLEFIEGAASDARNFAEAVEEESRGN
ncbi:MAG: hypothetical protein ACYTKD_02860 [Planctomycetota bacterium]|jgi:hypothetical protein